MSKHTPGPWKVEKTSTGNNITSYLLPYVAAVSDGLRARNGEGDANARLIAAAPELLDALRIMVGTSQNLNLDLNAKIEGALKIAIAAIAKAEGK